MNKADIPTLVQSLVLWPLLSKSLSNIMPTSLEHFFTMQSIKHLQK